MNEIDTLIQNMHQRLMKAGIDSSKDKDIQAVRGKLEELSNNQAGDELMAQNRQLKNDVAEAKKQAASEKARADSYFEHPDVKKQIAAAARDRASILKSQADAADAHAKSLGA
jgi:hypothetical protein